EQVSLGRLLVEDRLPVVVGQLSEFVAQRTHPLRGYESVSTNLARRVDRPPGQFPWVGPAGKTRNKSAARRPDRRTCFAVFLARTPPGGGPRPGGRESP